MARSREQNRIDKLQSAREQTRSEKLKRDTSVIEEMSRDEDIIEEYSPFVAFIVVFFRHTFGSRFIRGKTRRVLMLMGVFGVVYWFVSAFLIDLGITSQSRSQTVLGLGVVAIAYLAVAIFRKSQVRLAKIRRFELHSRSSGKSYFLPLGRRWIRFLNHRAVDLQLLWNKLLSKKAKFEPRQDLFWNDVGVTRKHIEPFVALVITLIVYFVFNNLLLTIWFALVTIMLRSDANSYNRRYHEHYDNMQDNELIAQSKARVLRRRKENAPYNDMQSRIRRAVEFGDTTEIEEELHQEIIMLKQEQADSNHDLERLKYGEEKFDKPAKGSKKGAGESPGDFSLDDAFDSLQDEPKE